LITVGISESDAKIKHLALRFFQQQGLHCGSSLIQTDKDIVFCSASAHNKYDVLIENASFFSNANADYIFLLNTDENIYPVAQNKNPIIITYGLNGLATATASSITSDESKIQFLFCLQRNIVTLKGKIIECQEFPVSINTTTDIHGAIAFTLLALILGVSPERISKTVL
jgi:UDP-N-acetylmuramyl pentapeptide synthase